MKDEYNEIILKARELADMIKKSRPWLKYQQALTALEADPDSQKILERLISMGQEVWEKISCGESDPGSREGNEILMAELQEHPLVMEFILAQKEYLDLLKGVISQIKNP